MIYSHFLKITGIFLLISCHTFAQTPLTPETLWSLGRVNGITLSPDGTQVYYTVTRYNKEENKGNTQIYYTNLKTKNAVPYSQAKNAAGNLCFADNGLSVYMNDGELSSSGFKTSIGISGSEYDNLLLSPDGKNLAFSREVKALQTKADLYPEYPKSEARIYDDLMFRHWNVWEDGIVNHIHVANMEGLVIKDEIDAMKGEAFDAPTLPSGGNDEMAWSADSKYLAYVCVKKLGKEYAISTNSDIYFYEIATGKTTNVTSFNKGYDKNPSFSPDGKYFSWTAMRRDGYEADKTDIMLMDLNSKKVFNLTKNWDDFVNAFFWSKDCQSIYFLAPYRGVDQIFEIKLKDLADNMPATVVHQITNTDFDYNQIIGISYDGKLICSRTDMNHAAEIYSVDPKNGNADQITFVNDDAYAKIKKSKIEKKWIKTSDGKQMLAYVIFPPDFDPTKKYPTLLYCQGGPQSALSQFYSFRWNFQLMAANGYIVVAPNRRGMPGWGTKWNEQISGDWGGQVMKDYLAAIDQVSENAYVDKSRLGCVGASYGGYSVMMLAGIHKNRFKTFITHCGTFNTESWYGSTEEMWFANFDLKEAYWDNPKAKAYTKFSPHRYVKNWNKPILIIQGGKDYRIPDTQAFEAFTAARMHNLKSRLLYIPDEGHHILKIQNGLLWQHEFYRWLKETL